MIEIFKYYGKRVQLLVAFTLILIIGKQFADFGSSMLINFFIWAMAYRLGTEERMQGTWQYFQSLPLKFSQKILIKVVVPFLIFISLLFLAGADQSYQMPTQFISQVIALAAVMVAVSLSAKGVTSFVLMGVVGNFIVYAIDYPPNNSIVAALALAHAVYYLSDYRLNRGRSVALGVVVAVGLMFLHQSIVGAMITNMLKSSELEERLFAAEYILDEGEHDQDARAVVAASLTEQLSPRQLRRVLRMIDRYDIGLTYPESVYWRYIERDAVSREAIFDYLEDVEMGTDFYRSQSFRDQSESLVLTGSDGCRDDCQALADLLAPHYMSLPDAEQRLKAYLESNQWQQIEFALLIIERQPEIILKDDLKALLERVKDEGMKVRIELLINDWKSDRLGHELSEKIGDMVDRYLNENLSKEERRKVRQALREALDDIEVDIIVD